jgi:hypothetical protein
MQFLRVHGKFIPSRLRCMYRFNVLSKKKRKSGMQDIDGLTLSNLERVMTTTTHLYKQDQMTGQFKAQTQARVDEDRAGGYSCIVHWWQREELPQSDSARFVT